MRHILIILAALAVILLGAWGTLVLYFDEVRLKSMVREEVERRTGRDLEIRGPLRLRLLPRIAVEARDVYLSGPAEYEGPGLFEAERLSLSLRLWPLVRGEIETGDVELEGAELRVHTDRSGRSSMGDLYRDSSAEWAGVEPSVMLRAGRIRIQNVALVISDAATRDTNRLQIDLLELERFVRDLPASFMFRGSIGDPPMLDPVLARGILTVPSDTGPVTMDRLSLNGRFAGTAHEFTLDGRLLAELGTPMAIELADGRLQVDRDHFELALRYVDSARPRVAAQAAGRHLDLDALIGALPAATGAANGHSKAAPGMTPLMLFSELDLDASLRLDGMRVAALDLDQVSARAQVRDGILVIDPLAGELAGGRLDAHAEVNFREVEPVISMTPRFHVERLAVALAPWGLDTIVDGRGDITLDLHGRGLESDDLLRSLTGTGSYSLQDGRIRGIDLNALAEGIRTREPAGAAAAIGGETRFDELSGTFEVRGGRLRLPDLALVSERLGLAGNVDLVLADLSLDGRLQMSGDRLEWVPLTVGGSLSAPRLSPDVAGVARDELGRRLLEGLERRLGDERDTDPPENEGGRHDQ